MRSSVAVLACTLAVLSGCARGSSGSGGKPDVVVGVYPLAYVADRVGGVHIAVDDLTPAGVEPHDLELTPAQVGAVRAADLVLLVRGLQPALDAAARGDAVVDAARLGTPATPALATDPHVWLDPVRMRDIALDVTRRLVLLDAENRAYYVTAGGSLVTDLDRLDAEIRRGLQTCKRHEIVTSHEAFGHFAARYGLRQVGIAGLSPEEEPSPARLAEVAKFVKANNVTTIFTEALLSPKVAQTVAREAHVKTAVLDPIESVRPGDDYVTVMRRNLEALRAALDCT